MEYFESEEITMLRDSIRKFVAKEITRERAAEWDRTDTFSFDVYNKLAELGYMGLSIPEEYGGSGVNIPATMAVIEELAKASLAIATPYLMCTCYAGMNMVECASEEQKREYLPKIASGEIFFAYGLTEPDVGADLGSVKTTAVRDGDEVIINGSKRFCSGANIAPYIYCLVNSDKDGERYKNLSFILVPPKSAGVTVELIETMGNNGVPATDVTFQDVRVPAANIVGGEAGWNRGWEFLAGPGLDTEKLEVATIGLGLSSAAVEDAWAYVQERKQFGKRILEYQSIRHKLAEMHTKLHGIRLMVNHAARLLNEKRPASVETSMAKMFSTEMAKEITLECQTIMGAYGYVKEFPAERYVRDALGAAIYGGSTAIQKNNIVNRLGLPKK